MENLSVSFGKLNSAIKEKKDTIKLVLCIIGVICAIAAVAVLIIKLLEKKRCCCGKCKGECECEGKNKIDILDEVDLDDDGTVDAYLVDTDGDGDADSVYVDTDGNGAIDTIIEDTDGDGEPDTVFGPEA